MVGSLNSLDSEVMVVRSEFVRSKVVRFLLLPSSGVVGSSPLFCASGICVCSCTMGGWASDTLSLAVRFDMFGREAEASDGSERDEPKPATCERLLLGPTSGEVEGRMGGTLGEKREMCGVLVELPAPLPLGAGAAGAKVHVSS
jgi:hypothetical protein